MKIILEEEVRKESLITVAKRMMIAARTAPKARGIDNLVISFVERDTIAVIANKMKEMVEKGISPEFYIRDANNILVSDLLFLIGTRLNVAGVKQCGLCGFTNCEEKNSRAFAERKSYLSMQMVIESNIE